MPKIHATSKLYFICFLLLICLPVLAAEDADAEDEKDPYIEHFLFKDADYRGIVFAAPHEGHDKYTSDMVKLIHKELGAPAVIAYNYRDKKRKVHINVNRPSENVFEDGEKEAGEKATERALKVYREYRNKIKAAGGGLLPIRLLFEIHGNNRKIEDGENEHIVEVGEVVTQGFDTEQMMLIREFLNRAVAHHKPEKPIQFEILGLAQKTGRQYYYKPLNKEIPFKYTAGRTTRTGSLRREVSYRSIHVELPSSSRYTQQNREAYARIFRDLVRFLVEKGLV